MCIRDRALRPAEKALGVSGPEADDATGAAGEEDMGGQDGTSGENAAQPDAIGESAAVPAAEPHDDRKTESVAPPESAAASGHADVDTEHADAATEQEDAAAEQADTDGTHAPTASAGEAPPSLAPRLRADRKERIA